MFKSLLNYLLIVGKKLVWLIELRRRITRIMEYKTSLDSGPLF